MQLYLNGCKIIEKETILGSNLLSERVNFKLPIEVISNLLIIVFFQKHGNKA